MAEIEFGGVKFTGGKMVGVATALITLVGSLYGGFEVYKDYMDMKEKIVAYTAPDMSGFDEIFEVQYQIKRVEEKIDDMVILVKEAQEISRDIRTDLKEEINRQSDTIYKIDKRTSGTDREIRALIRESEKDARDMIKDAEDRLDLTRRKLDSDMKELQNNINKQINRTLKNPLNALTQ